MQNYEKSLSFTISQQPFIEYITSAHPSSRWGFVVAKLDVDGSMPRPGKSLREPCRKLSFNNFDSNRNPSKASTKEAGK